MKSMYIGLRCTLCGSVYSTGDRDRRAEPSPMTCPKCGEKGILDVEYDYDAIGCKLTREYLLQNNDPTIWRYVHLLPVDDIPAKPLLNVGMTPLYRALNLAGILGMNELYVKDDGLNPTGSLKDRASIIAVAKALEEGEDTICCSSTGNAASSLAGNAARAGLKTVIFVPKRAPHGKLAQLLIYGSKLVVVDGDYKKAFEMSKAAIRHFGFYSRNAAVNPYLVEGKKTVALEISEQLNYNVPDWVVVSVGDGCTIGGVYKGFYDMYRLGITDRIPKILGVQASGCNPFEAAFRNNTGLIEAEENTIADSIAVGIPRNPVKGLQAVSRSNGTFISVSDHEILEGMRLLGSTEGIFSEPAASASTAGLVKALETGVVKVTERVAVINTGNGLKDIASGLKAVAMPDPIEPDPERIIELLEASI